MAVPRDVRQALEEAGVRFDDQGNIIEDENETFIENVEEYEDDEDDDQELDHQDDEGEDDDSDESEDTDDDSEDEQDDDEDADDDEDEVEEQPKSKKRKPKAKKPKDEDSDDDDDLPRLTPKELQKQKEDGDEAINEIRKNLKVLLEKGNSLSDEQGDSGDVDTAMAELRREAEEFRKMRFQAFASNIKDRVKQSNYGVGFDDIINSTQWEEFLNKKAYGSRIGDLYRTAIQSQDADSVLFFFDDFASKYLQRAPKQEKSVKKQRDDLDDLAVPDKTKTSGTPKKRKQFDFEEADYITKLDQAERGIITREEFIKFNDAFESALSKGRVKPSR